MSSNGPLAGAGLSVRVTLEGADFSFSQFIRSDTDATISPAIPQLVQPPSIANRCPVFSTEETIFSHSIGFKTLKSMTSASGEANEPIAGRTHGTLNQKDSTQDAHNWPESTIRRTALLMS